jgi:hypothetical protein
MEMKTKLVFNINNKPYITEVNEDFLFLETEKVFDLKEGDSKLALRYIINSDNKYEDIYKNMSDEEVFKEIERLEKEKVKLLEETLAKS